MLVNGVWWLGPGDSGDEIRKIKAFMRQKFPSYAGQLLDTDVYDKATFDAVSEMQQPSIHPEGRAYWWRNSAGQIIGIPNPDELPDLPVAWIEALKFRHPQPPVQLLNGLCQ